MRNPASEERTSDSVELWDTDVCFLHIHRTGTNVRLAKMHKIPSEVYWTGNKCSTSKYAQNSIWGRFWIFKITSKAWVLEQSQSAVLRRKYPHGNIVCNHSCDECAISSEPSVCHRLLSILWLLVPVLFTYQRMVCLPVRTKYNHVKTIWKHSHSFQFFLCELMVVETWCRDLVQLLWLCISQFTIPFNALFSITFHVIITSDSFRLRFWQPGNFSVAAADSWFEHFSLFMNHTFVRFTFTISASQVHVVKKRCWFSQVNQFHHFLPHRIEVSLLSSHVNAIHMYG